MDPIQHISSKPNEPDRDTREIQECAPETDHLIRAEASCAEIEPKHPYIECYAHKKDADADKTKEFHRLIVPDRTHHDREEPPALVPEIRADVRMAAFEIS